MTRHFCTYFDHQYLPRGMVMLKSLHEHYLQAHVHVLCLSDECHVALSAMAYPFVTLIRLDELEAADLELAATRSTRSRIEYYFTITSCLLWHLLNEHGLDEVTYLDADMMFFSSPEPLFDEAGDASVIITPHRFSPHLKHLSKYGLYNVSWMTFRNTPPGLVCLSWYRKACLEWCFDRLEERRYADQKYLDVFPVSFAGVHIMTHPGGGLAPWNLEGADICESPTGLRIAGAPLIFYHAQGVMHIAGPFYITGLQAYRAKLNNPAVVSFLKEYISRYARASETALQLIDSVYFFGIRRSKKLNYLRKGKHLLLGVLTNTIIRLPPLPSKGAR